MNPISINVTEKTGIERRGEILRIGIPLASRQLMHSQNLSLSCMESKQQTPCQFKELAHWPDGSIRWLQASFLNDMAANQTKTMQLRDNEQLAPATEASIKQNTSGLTITTACREFLVSSTTLEWRTGTTQADQSSSVIQLNDQQGMPCTARLTSNWTVVEQGPVSVAINANGRWLQSNEKALAHFDCTLRFFNHIATVEVELSLHNPNRARHTGGLWDLGDPGSIYFSSLGMHISMDNSSHHEQSELEVKAGQAPITSQPGQSISIYQDSSGGEHWDSRNHVKADGTISTSFKGYQIQIAEQAHSSGDRAQPIIRYHTNGHTLQACISHFWENFPSALRADTQALWIGFFPANEQQSYELQAGEQKTQRCFIHYSDDKRALQWTRAPLVPTLGSQHYEDAKAFPWFRSQAGTGALEELIAEGLSGDSNFFVKREAIDEYGWRNFGEIFADHETLYQDGDEPLFISHYNNQYDAILGFARQFALSGDTRWFELMDDLARHVTDIDIYHTDEDRAEYNNGLFWHTDHYLDASTATHRTYTRNSATSSIPGQTGGGPAAEHCYSSGLLYHYYLTGSDASRQAVIGLANWMVALHEGTGGLLEQLLNIKKHDLPKLKALMRGESPTSHIYPFTRGTGNYINTLLDAWLLTGERHWLDKAEEVIRATIHPADDLTQRDLLNVEVSWSYLILLSSLARYLDSKKTIDEIDENYHYTLDSFIRYTYWMVKNEQPFLEQAEQLEFPNDTWTAQDIRKAMLMFQAAYFDPENRDIYLNKANDWLNDITGKLQNSPEAHYARILIVLMQNYGPHQPRSTALKNGLARQTTRLEKQVPRLTYRHLIARMIARLSRGIINFRPARERQWLNARLNR